MFITAVYFLLPLYEDVPLNRVSSSNPKLFTFTQILVEYPPPAPPPSAAD